MSKITDMILETADKNISYCKGIMESIEAKRVGSDFSFWAEWNLSSMVESEEMMRSWMFVRDFVIAMATEGNSDADIIKALTGYLEDVVSQILRHSTKYSTCPVSNRIDQIKDSVRKEFVGGYGQFYGDRTLKALINKASGLETAKENA